MKKDILPKFRTDNIYAFWEKVGEQVDPGVNGHAQNDIWDPVADTCRMTELLYRQIGEIV